MIKQMYRIHSIYNNMLNNNTKKDTFLHKKNSFKKSVFIFYL